ncbi:hypothetical protein C8035_v012394 [Colletotrichum spinosum]|uniref:Uncharacterized protein n=1 Tax=Colletotrichum spinosum TaxID=1347390 RepID=A0A4R8Q232_9PEZI|nr:hypothetical protein C8035_v012394 [Colletotrichum spinosum]
MAEPRMSMAEPEIKEPKMEMMAPQMAMMDDPWMDMGMMRMRPPKRRNLQEDYAKVPWGFVVLGLRSRSSYKMANREEIRTITEASNVSVLPQSPK